MQTDEIQYCKLSYRFGSAKGKLSDVQSFLDELAKKSLPTRRQIIIINSYRTYLHSETLPLLWLACLLACRAEKAAKGVQSSAKTCASFGGFFLLRSRRINQIQSDVFVEPMELCFAELGVYSLRHIFNLADVAHLFASSDRSFGCFFVFLVSSSTQLSSRFPCPLARALG